MFTHFPLFAYFAWSSRFAPLVCFSDPSFASSSCVASHVSITGAMSQSLANTDRGRWSHFAHALVLLVFIMLRLDPFSLFAIESFLSFNPAANKQNHKISNITTS